MEIEKCSKAERDWSKSEGRVSQEAAVAEREETGLGRDRSRWKGAWQSRVGVTGLIPDAPESCSRPEAG